MLMFLAMLCLLVLTACILTWVADAPFAQTLPLTITAGTLVTYLFTAAGEKEWLVPVLPVVVLVLAFLAWRRRDGEKAPRFGPAFFAFVLAIAAVAALSGHLQLTIFDDLSHWGLFTRQICGMDKFPAAAQSASTFSDYPPGLQMLAALLHLGAGRASVRTMFIAQILWYVGLTLPLLADFGWRRTRWADLPLVAGMSAFLLIFPAFYTKYHQMSLVVEPVMALLLGWALLTAWRSPRPGFWDLAAVGCGLSVLVISKSTGPLYALAGAAAVLVLWREPLWQLIRRGSWPARCTALAAALAAPAFWYSWKLLCRLKGTSSYFTQDVAEGALSLENLRAFFAGQGQSRPVIAHFFRFFCIEPLNRAAGLSALGFLLVFWLLAWRLGRLVPARARALRVAGVILTVVFLAYAVGLCFSYVYLFDADEGEQLAAYHRYIAPLPVAMLYLALGALAPFTGRLRAAKRRWLAPVCAAAVFAVGINWTAATELVPGFFLPHRQLDPQEAVWAQEQTELQPVFDSLPDQLRRDDAATLVVTDAPSWDHDCRLYKFDLTPGQTLSLNPVEFGGRMAEAYAAWAAEEQPLKYVFCAWNGEAAAAQAALADTDGAPLRANCLYRLEEDGGLVLEKELAAPAR